MTERAKKTAIALLLAAGMAACDKVPLLAPSNSTINLSTSTRVLPFNGTAQLTAFVTESSGTPVQNGTTVRFTTTLGRVEPVDTQTRNGSVTVTFFAGTSSGVAEVRALSGAAGGGTSGTGTGTTTTTAQNVVQITIGTAAIKTVTLRANPSTVGPNGGLVELIATVVGDTGSGLPGIPVTFNADQGVLSVQTVPTDANGEARTVLTTAQKTSVTATAGIVTSTPATVVDVRTGPGVSIACAPATGGGTNCAAVAPSSSNAATVVFTVSKATGTSNLRDVTITYGDGTSQSLGNLSGGSATVTHTYSGPSGSGPNSYTATALATDVNGETSLASTTVVVSPRAPLGVTISATKGTASNSKVPFTFKANVTGATDIVEYTWDFDDDQTLTTSSGEVQHIYAENSAIRTVKVTVKTTDGRTANGQTQISP